MEQVLRGRDESSIKELTCKEIQQRDGIDMCAKNLETIVDRVVAKLQGAVKEGP